MASLTISKTMPHKTIWTGTSLVAEGDSSSCDKNKSQGQWLSLFKKYQIPSEVDLWDWIYFEKVYRLMTRCLRLLSREEELNQRSTQTWPCFSFRKCFIHIYRHRVGKKYLPPFRFLLVMLLLTLFVVSRCQRMLILYNVNRSENKTVLK